MPEGPRGHPRLSDLWEDLGDQHVAVQGRNQSRPKERARGRPLPVQARGGLRSLTARCRWVQPCYTWSRAQKKEGSCWAQTVSFLQCHRSGTATLSTHSGWAPRPNPLPRGHAGSSPQTGPSGEARLLSQVFRPINFVN